jgi:hypothetical protein
MKRRRLMLAVAVPFTVLAAVLFCALVAGIAASFRYRPTVEMAGVEMTGSGGIGAVSVGIPAMPLALTLLFVAAAIFLNVSLAADARRRGRAAVWLRRGHLVLTTFTLFWPVTLFGWWILLEPSGTLSALLVIESATAAAAAAHVALGVWAIRSAIASSSSQIPLD